MRDSQASRLVSITVWLAIGIAAVSLILAAAVGWVADGATKLGHIDDAAHAAELSRVQLSAAVLLAEQAELGLVAPDTPLEAAHAASASLLTVQRAVLQVPEHAELAAAYLQAAGELVEALESQTRARDLPDLEPIRTSLDRLVAALEIARIGHEEQLVVLKSRSSPITLVATFVVVLAGPLALIGAHQSWMDRRLEAGGLRQQLLANEAILQSKNEFLANVSHELRTPLTGIYGLTRMLEDPDSDQEERQELIGLITHESAELLRMVDDILTLGRVDAGVLNYQPKALDPWREIRSVVEPIELHRGSIKVDCDGSRAHADPLRLRQLLRNLVSNADRHGGARMEVAGFASDDHYHIVVRDDGPGVPDALLDSLFSRFLHRDATPLLAGSIGLGLHIAKLLAEGMDGHLAYARNGGWTEFTVRLPRAATVVRVMEELAHA